MPSMYLAQSELNTYGIPNATTPQIIQASTLVDAYLRRPEGLEYIPDYAGLPCYMAGLTPSITLTVPGGISPGSNVVLQVAGASILSQYGHIGDVVIVDRASATQGQTGVVEACVISAITATSITLTSVANTHAANVKLEFGLVINESKSMPQRRSTTRLGCWPIVRIHSGMGSFRYGRRDDQQAGLWQDATFLAMIQTFGGPPLWLQWAVPAADFNGMTGEVWIPAGLYQANYSDIRVHYVAGFTKPNIPSIIKQCVASIINAGINTAEMAGGIKVARAGDTALTRFANTVLDADTRAQLNVYQPRSFV
jgi:hypothetical protein